MKRGKTLLALFWEFFQFGCFTFGGGWSIVAQMQRLYVEKRKTITGEELLDITSVGRSLPGTMIGNVAMLYGNHAAGLAGGVVCLVAMILPPFLILSVLTLCYTAVRDNYWVMAAMTGVRLPVSALRGGGGGVLRPVPDLGRELRVSGTDGHCGRTGHL